MSLFVFSLKFRKGREGGGVEREGSRYDGMHPLAEDTAVKCKLRPRRDWSSVLGLEGRVVGSYLPVVLVLHFLVVLRVALGFFSLTYDLNVISRPLCSSGMCVFMQILCFESSYIFSSA